jgi:hypothetical protein
MAGPVVECAAAREAGAEMVRVSEDPKTTTGLQSVAVDGATAGAQSRVTSDYTADEVRCCECGLAVEVGLTMRRWLDP